MIKTFSMSTNNVNNEIKKIQSLLCMIQHHYDLNKQFQFSWNKILIY